MGHILAPILGAFQLVHVVSATGNSTAEAPRRGWVDEPDCGRGTTSLLYSCLFTIFICTWNALHLNLPADHDGHMEIFLRKLKGMIWTILAPEFLTLIALNDYLDAKVIAQKLSVSMNHERLDMTTAFFAQMGGFSIKSREGRTLRLSPVEMIALLEEGVIDPPEAPAKAIKDKSKADWLAKTLACLQIIWLVTQLIGRAREKLPITTLELFTAALVACTICTYAAWWRKPFDVRTPIEIPTDLGYDEIVNDLRAKNSSWSPVKRVSLWDAHSGPFYSEFLANQYSGVVCLVFGGIHVAAWNFSFPTVAEQMLWRVSSILTLTLPLLLVLEVIFVTVSKRLNFFLIKYINLPSLALYILVRLYLLVECFVSLRSVPARVYQDVNWSLYIPHI
ncbi:MAG: hypothetical protein M1827_005431 [Pycnora praestabilis]|nr:MAG: hypothetical protein M1827_005431 [Pycnora praestabilis]